MALETVLACLNENAKVLKNTHIGVFFSVVRNYVLFTKRAKQYAL